MISNPLANFLRYLVLALFGLLFMTAFFVLLMSFLRIFAGLQIFGSFLGSWK